MHQNLHQKRCISPIAVPFSPLLLHRRPFFMRSFNPCPVSGPFCRRDQIPLLLVDIGRHAPFGDMSCRCSPRSFPTLGRFLLPSSLCLVPPVLPRFPPGGRMPVCAHLVPWSRPACPFCQDLERAFTQGPLPPTASTGPARPVAACPAMTPDVACRLPRAPPAREKEGGCAPLAQGAAHPPIWGLMPRFFCLPVASRAFAYRATSS